MCLPQWRVQKCDGLVLYAVAAFFHKWCPLFLQNLLKYLHIAYICILKIFQNGKFTYNDNIPVTTHPSKIWEMFSTRVKSSTLVYYFSYVYINFGLRTYICIQFGNTMIGKNTFFVNSSKYECMQHFITHDWYFTFLVNFRTVIH